MLKKILLLLFLNSLLASCIDNSKKLVQGSKVTVKPQVILESAYESFYVNDELESELSKIEFASSRHLKGNPECLSLMRINISGSTTYDKLILTLKKRAFDFGGNAIGIYDYKEIRRVYVNQSRVQNKSTDNKYVLVKENKNVAKVTADLFKCSRNSS